MPRRKVNTSSLKEHSEAYLIPLMRPNEWQGFIADIGTRGILEDIIVLGDGTIIDGRHRWKAAKELNIPKVWVRDAELGQDDPAALMIRYALLRRHLSDDQRASMSKLWMERNKKSPPEAGAMKGKSSAHRGAELKDTNPTRAEATEKFNVSRKAAADASVIYNKAPELFEKVHAGELKLSEAKVLSNLNPSDRKDVLALVEKGEAKNIYTARKKVYRKHVANIKPPEGKYQVIYADPPWEYDFGFDIHGAALRHYPTMTIDELCNLPVKKMVDDNAVLFLWVTSPKLRDCFKVVDAWGFDYKTSFVWDKVKHVMGHYNSLRHEFLLVCVRGSYPKQSDTLQDSVVQIERKGAHSEKPDEFRNLIEVMYPQSKKRELFATKKSPGWDIWPLEGGFTND